jgi:hypothetical protein
LKTLQLKLGYRCTLSCAHCHVSAGPNRREQMDAETIATVATPLEPGRIDTLDLTGGAPELNPQFRGLVTAVRRLGVRVIDRCNLTVLLEPDQANLAEFLVQAGVEIIVSLPCYLQENVDRRRGKGVVAGSIDWRGYIDDCDFNQLLGLPLGAANGARVKLRELELHDLEERPIQVAVHCYGDTAGQGSSCSGALADRSARSDGLRWGHGTVRHHPLPGLHPLPDTRRRQDPPYRGTGCRGGRGAASPADRAAARAALCGARRAGRAGVTADTGHPFFAQQARRWPIMRSQGTRDRARLERMRSDCTRGRCGSTRSRFWPRSKSGLADDSCKRPRPVVVHQRERRF